MTRRKAKTKRIFLSVFLAIALCLFAFAGCQDTGKVSSIPEEDPVRSADIPSSASGESPESSETPETHESSDSSETSEIPETPDEDPIYGEYLGQNIYECYETWGLDPETDMELIEGPGIYAVLNEPVNYLGKEFTVALLYITGREGELSYYNDRLDSVSYMINYEDASDDTVAKEVVELLQALYEKYGDAEGEISNTVKSALRSVEKAGDASLMPLDIVHLKWILPEEAKKIDPEYIKLMEERLGETEYRVECSLTKPSGYYVFTVKHVYARSLASQMGM